MRIGKPFQLRGIQNDGDVFVPLYTKCCQCGRSFKIVIPEMFASMSLYGSRRLACAACGQYWHDVMETLGINGRDAEMPVKRVTIVL